jgi:hypothetical protein
MAVGAAAVLAAGAALQANEPPLAPRSSRLAELRDRFLVEKVARPMRDRLGQMPFHQSPRPGSREPLPVVPVPFLVPYAYPGPSCVEQVCSLVGGLGCDTDQRILRVLRMCSGNYSGDCVRAACGKLVSVECDTLEAIAPVVAACRSNVSGGCLETACNLMGSVQCQSQQTLAHILDACAGNVDGSCVSSVCANLGPAACTTVEELTLVAQSCGAYGYY